MTGNCIIDSLLLLILDTETEYLSYYTKIRWEPCRKLLRAWWIIVLELKQQNIGDIKNTKWQRDQPFFGAFAKLQKATFIFVMSVCMSFCSSVRPYGKLDSHCKGFHEIRYLSTFKNSVEKSQVSLKSDTNNSYFSWRQLYIFYHNSLNSS